MRRFLAALLMCGAVMGQTTIVMSKPPKAPETIVQLAKKLKRSQGAAWLLLDAPKADWVAGFRGLLGQDEDLMVLGLPLESYGPKTPLAAELRTQQGWGPEAAWALLGPGARVLGSGKTLPTARQLLDLAEGNGIRGELRDLESFVARHPGHVQAYRQLLVSHFGLAGRRTYRLVKPTMKKDAEGNPLPPEYPQPLTEADDERVWGRAAALLLPYVQSGDWRLANGGLIVAFQEAGQASPLLRAAALKCLSTVEEALRQDPGHYTNWSIWQVLAEAAGGRPLRPLLDSLVLLPGDRWGIPDSVFTTYARNARSREDWTGILDVLGPRWDQKKDQELEILFIGDDGARQDGLKSTWDSLLKPIVEAQLRLGRTLDADQVIRDAMVWMPSKGLPGWAAALAQACGQPSLATQWAALTVPKG